MNITYRGVTYTVNTKSDILRLVKQLNTRLASMYSNLEKKTGTR